MMPITVTIVMTMTSGQLAVMNSMSRLTITIRRIAAIGHKNQAGSFLRRRERRRTGGRRRAIACLREAGESYRLL